MPMWVVILLIITFGVTAVVILWALYITSTGALDRFVPRNYDPELPEWLKLREEKK